MAISTLKYALLVWFLMLVTFVILYFPTNTAGVATSDRKDIAQNSNTTMLPRPLITKVHNAPQHDVQTRNIVAVTARISESDRKPSAIEPVPTVDAVQRQVASQLISLHKPASSDVRGNLGPVSCITNETVSDWLADRWQAAKNMRGEPIPGEHWVEIDLQGQYAIDKIVIDWEVAFSNKWTIMGRATEAEEHAIICDSQHIISTARPNKMHVIQSVRVPSAGLSRRVRFVRLVIHRPATRYGSSIWRFQVWGRPAELVAASN